MNKFVTPIKVGLFVLAGVAAFVAVYSFVHKGGLSKRDSVAVVAIFHDASGLERRTAVQIAGIVVGEVTEIGLYKGQLARLLLRIRRTVHLHTDAAVTKRSSSLLGDSVLDLYPGSDDAPPMEEGGEIRVNEEGGIQKAFESLGKVAADVQAVTASLRDMVAGQSGSFKEIVSNLVKVSGSIEESITANSGKLDETLDNVHAFSAALAGASGGGSLKEIVENIKVASGEAKRALGTVDTILGSNQSDLTGNVAGVKQAIDKLNGSLDDLQKIMSKIEKGEGALGKLVSDEATGTQIQETVSGASDYVDHLVRLQTEVGLSADYMFGENAARATLELKLIPRPGKFFLFQFIDDSRGTPQYSFVQVNPAVPGYTVPAQAVITTTRSYKFSAEFGRSFDPATFRIGIIDSSAGGGVDLDIWRKNLSFTAEMFDFADPQQPYPRLRTYLAMNLLNHFTLRAGFDDVLNKWATRNLVDPQARGYTLGGREFFMGAGIYFNDGDVKTLVSSAPGPKP
jgi:phospholipid/cholesterol/gamma-HCH transport system substrate-binding protein